MDIPFVELFDNSCIIGMQSNSCWLSIWLFSSQRIFFGFSYNIDICHNKTRGLFTLLNDECVLQKPSIENFANNLKNAWQKDAGAPISWNINGKKSPGNVFLIRHFTNDVIYSTVCHWMLLTLLCYNNWFMIIQESLAHPGVVSIIFNKSFFFLHDDGLERFYREESESYTQYLPFDNSTIRIIWKSKDRSRDRTQIEDSYSDFEISNWHVDTTSEEDSKNSTKLATFWDFHHLQN